MIPKKYGKLPIDSVVTELYRRGSNPDFDFPPTSAKLLDILVSGLTPQSPQATLDASDYARTCGYTSQVPFRSRCGRIWRCCARSSCRQGIEAPGASS